MKAQKIISLTIFIHFLANLHVASRMELYQKISRLIDANKRAEEVLNGEKEDLEETNKIINAIKTGEIYNKESNYNDYAQYTSEELSDSLNNLKLEHRRLEKAIAVSELTIKQNLRTINQIKTQIDDDRKKQQAEIESQKALVEKQEALLNQLKDKQSKDDSEKLKNQTLELDALVNNEKNTDAEIEAYKQKYRVEEDLQKQIQAWGRNKRRNLAKETVTVSKNKSLKVADTAGSNQVMQVKKAVVPI